MLMVDLINWVAALLGASCCDSDCSLNLSCIVQRSVCSLVLFQIVLNCIDQLSKIYVFSE